MIPLRNQKGKIVASRAGLAPEAKLCSDCRRGGNQPGPSRSVFLI